MIPLGLYGAARPSGGVPVTFEWHGHYVAPAGTYDTFSNTFDVGMPGPDRYVWVILGSTQTAGAKVSGITINGVTPTLHSVQNDKTIGEVAPFYSLLVPDGETVDVVVNYSESMTTPLTTVGVLTIRGAADIALRGRNRNAPPQMRVQQTDGELLVVSMSILSNIGFTPILAPGTVTRMNRQGYWSGIYTNETPGDHFYHQHRDFSYLVTASFLPEGASSLIKDTFNRPNGTGLGTTDTGEEWLYTSSSGSSVWIVENGYARKTMNTNEHGLAIVDVGSPHMSVAATIVYTVTNVYNGVAAKATPGNASGYFLWTNGQGDGFELTRRTPTNVQTQLAGATVPGGVIGKQFRLEVLELPDRNLVTAYVGGDRVTYYDDTAGTRPRGTHGGLFQYTNHTAAKLDDFSIRRLSL